MNRRDRVARLDRHSPGLRAALWIAVPPLLAAAYLGGASVAMFGSVVRPGLFAEILVVLYLSLVMSMVQRRPPVAALLTSLPVLLFYSVCAIKWLFLGEAVSLSDLGLLDEFLFTLPRSWIAALVVGGAALAGAMAWLFLAHVGRPRLIRASAVLVPLALYAVGVFAFPDRLVAAFEVVRPDIHWRPDLNLWRNGPIYTLARELPGSVRTRRQLARTRATPGDARSAISAAALAAGPPPVRSLHVVLLESFVDPLDFRRAALPVDPVDPRLRRWLRESDSLALSPTFGGRTAAVEFEVLCGLPAYDLLGLEFNLLGGAPIPCLPRLLRERGYTTVSSAPLPPSFFNTGRAYRAVGFDHRFFARDFDMSDLDGEWLSSAALFRQTLARAQLATAPGTPVFSYVVTTSGHGPFDLDQRRRPPIVPGHSWVSRLASAVHYNSAATADFVEALEARDREAIVVLFGDHLPILGTRLEGFRDGGYARRGGRADLPAFWVPESPAWLESRVTPVVIRKARQTVPVGIVPHFVLPEVILDLLSDGAYCRATECLGRRAIIYRPRLAQPLFTTRAALPIAVCERGSGEGDASCVTARRLHEAMRLAYDVMLHEGMRQPPP